MKVYSKPQIDGVYFMFYNREGGAWKTEKFPKKFLFTKCIGGVGVHGF